MELEVAIQKQMPGFRLEVAFQGGGKTVGLLGPSGSGKSMTLRCIAGLETPDSGRIMFNGRALFDSSLGVNVPSRERRVGFLLQDYALFPHMTLRDNIAFGLNGLSRSAAIERVNRQIDLFQLKGLDQRFPRQLSGGQQQRAALARALATEPELLLLDEPLSALDVHLRSQMETLLVETLDSFHGVSVYVTHNLEEAFRIAGEIAVISNGREIAFGPKDHIFRHPPNLDTARVTGCKNFSRIQRNGSREVRAIDWGCTVELFSPPPGPFEWIAIRAHHIRLGLSAGPNSAPCSLARVIEGPFRMTLFLRVLTPDAPAAHHHLQAEVTRETWDSLIGRESQWHVILAPEALMTF